MIDPISALEFITGMILIVVPYVSTVVADELSHEEEIRDETLAFHRKIYVFTFIGMLAGVVSYLFL